MWFGPSLMMGAKNFATITTTYNTDQTVSPPIGAAFADIECIGGGGAGTSGWGGQGGNYNFATISLASISSIQISVGLGGSTGDGGSTAVLANSSTVCRATGGFSGGSANTDPGTGSVPRFGGIGSNVGTEKYGGGAAGSNGNGGAAVNNGDGTSSPGAGGGSPAGDGGQLYGGGGTGGAAPEAGRNGVVRITYRG